MTLLWMDGFDHYGTSSNVDGYGVYASATGTISTTQKRTGSYSWSMSNSGSLRRVFPTVQSSVGIGFAIYLTDLPQTSSYVMPLKIIGESGNGQCFLTINNSGVLALWAGTGTGGASQGTKIAETASPVITTGSWAHIEIYFVPNGASSTAEVRLNLATVINETFQEGSTSGGEQSSTTTAAMSMAHGGVLGNVYIDDLFAWNAEGSFNNDFIGDKRVHTMMPTADTATADWLKNSGSVGYDRINEIGPDGDTSYIYSSTSTNASQFAIANMPADTGAIAALQTYRGTRKTDSGTCNVQTTIVSGAYTTSGTSAALTTAYQYYQDVFETDPATGALWTKSGVDGAEVRVTRTA
jgi:hypothetical protein